MSEPSSEEHDEVVVNEQTSDVNLLNLIRDLQSEIKDMKQKQTPPQLSVPLTSMTPQRAKQSTGPTAQTDLNVFYEEDHDYVNLFASQSEYETDNENENSLQG